MRVDPRRHPARAARELRRRGAQWGTGDDGLLQRFQLLVWPDVAGAWRDVDRWPDSDAREAASAVFERLDRIDAAAYGAAVEPGRAPFLRFDEVALEAFRDWRRSFECRLRDGSLHDAMLAHLGKYRSLVPALALLCHLASGGTGAVGLRAVMKACGWAEYLESHARRLYQGATPNGSSASHALAEKVKTGALADGFTARDIYRKGWSRLTDKAAVEVALAELVEHDWLCQDERETGGRPRTIYRIHPQLRQGQG